MRFNQINFSIIALLTILMLAIFGAFGLEKIVFDFLAGVSFPGRVLSTQIYLQAEKPLILFKKSFNSARKVQMLEGRYAEVLAQLTDLKKLEEENRQLRSLLENSDRNDREVIIAAPIISQVGPAIGVGESSGVVKGDLVFVNQTLIGRVREVFANHSEIDLINQADFSPIVVQTEEGYKGLVKGDGRRAILTEILPTEVPPGESRIETIGQVGVERGLFVGQVGKLLSQPAETVTTYQIIQQVDFYQASVVEIYK